MLQHTYPLEELLESSEGISTNILANRLKLLEDLGLVEKQPYIDTATAKALVITHIAKSSLSWSNEH